MILKIVNNQYLCIKMNFLALILDLDLDKSEDVSAVEGENMSDNLDNSLFKLHKKSAGKNSFSPQKTLNGARHRIKSKVGIIYFLVFL